MPFLGLGALFVVQRTGILDIPSWLNSQDASSFSGGQVEAGMMDNLSLGGFQNKALQDAFEHGVEECIPMKASALLGNAAVQRAAIAASDVLF